MLKIPFYRKCFGDVLSGSQTITKVKNIDLLMVKKFKFTKGPMAFVKNWKFRNYFFKKKVNRKCLVMLYW